ncbi:MAG: hypothetical protein PHQ23_15610 [Candidatus Wallbacteria bacterium]|nr:hypothetical protein [Candidatus Wallbacteria bacterium]
MKTIISLLAVTFLFGSVLASPGTNEIQLSSKIQISEKSHLPWHKQVHFTFVNEVEDELATDLGLTINGFWTCADPEEEKAAGRLYGNVSFVIAAWGDVIEDAQEEFGLNIRNSVSRDIFGNPAVPEWYIRDHDMPDTLAMSINNRVFMDFLKKQSCSLLESSNFLLVDECMTHIALIGLEKQNTGFGVDDLRVWKDYLKNDLHLSFSENLMKNHQFPPMTEQEMLTLFNLESIRDFDICSLLRTSNDAAGISKQALEAAKDSVFQEYAWVQQQNAASVMTDFFHYINKYKKDRKLPCMIGANIGIGDSADWSPLCLPMYDDLLNFTVTEMTSHDFSPLPTGKLLPSWKIAGSLSAGRPFGLLSVVYATSLNKKFTNDHRDFRPMNTVLFYEALSCGGNFAFGWAYGPQAYISDHLYLKPHISFVKKYRELFELETRPHALGVFYGNQALLEKSDDFPKYTGLACGLAALGYGFDVIHSGDDEFRELPVNRSSLGFRRKILIPMASAFSKDQKIALKTVADKVVFFSLSDEDLRGIGTELQGVPLADFLTKQDQTALEPLKKALSPLEPDVTGTPLNVYALPETAADGKCMLVHLVNYNYDEKKDTVSPQGQINLNVLLPDGVTSAYAVRWIRPGADPVILQGTANNGRLSVTVPGLDIYGMLLIGEPDRVAELLH